jgi:hypothetical protein
MLSKVLWCFAIFCVVHINAQKSSESPVKTLKKIYDDCENDSDFLKCMKIQAIKATDRALKIPNIKIVEGLSMVQKENQAEGLSRAINEGAHLSENEMRSLPSDKLDNMIFDLASKFINTHQVQLNIPRLFSSQDTPRLVEEGRKKMKKYLGPFIAAMAIKSGILTMVYHSIAIVAGKALIIGKIALVISAIIGLKKLVTPEGHEKTTYEIVKHPHVQNSHTFSSSNHGDFDSHDSGQYHRSLADNADMLMQDRAYRGHF